MKKVNLTIKRKEREDVQYLWNGLMSDIYGFNIDINEKKALIKYYISRLRWLLDLYDLTIKDKYGFCKLKTNKRGK